jgi:hypothetical protein
MRYAGVWIEAVLFHDLPCYVPTQLSVAGAFMHVSPWGYVLLSLAWLGGSTVPGLLVFRWRTGAPAVHVVARDSEPLIA